MERGNTSYSKVLWHVLGVDAFQNAARNVLVHVVDPFLQLQQSALPVLNVVDGVVKCLQFLVRFVVHKLPFEQELFGVTVGQLDEDVTLDQVAGDFADSLFRLVRVGLDEPLERLK